MKKLLLNLSFGVLGLSGILFTSSFATLESENAKGKTFASDVQCMLANRKELVLKVNEINDKNMSTIRNSIESGGGLIFKGYCSSMHILMYLVDRDVHPDNTFLNKLTVQNFTFEIKEGASIASVCSTCGITPEFDPTLETE